MIKAGIDIFKNDSAAIMGNRTFDLVTGSSVIDGEGNPVYRVVKDSCKGLRSLWALQHGFFLDKQDNMILSDSFEWKDSGMKVYSLYGEKLLPEDQWIEGLDALLIDVFDVGTRVYTFINHLLMIMKWLSGKGVDIVVLDRPNPLNGIDLEASLPDEDYFSIVGMLPVPMRHGLTVGEFLKYGVEYWDIDIKLEIVKAEGWKRSETAGQFWTYPSPNMPGFSTSLVYPGGVMLEGTNISEGRGTTKPFEFCGTPWLDNFALEDFLKSLKFDNLRVTPIFFKPEFSKYKGEVCKGILVYPTDPLKGFESFGIYYEIIRFVSTGYPEKFAWSQPPYEFEYKKPPIDMICGGPLIRESIENRIPWSVIGEKIKPQIDDYRNRVEDFLLY